MSKSEDIDALRTIVEFERLKKANVVAENLLKATGLYPDGWRLHKDGILWHGFYIFQHFDIAGWEPYLATRVKRARTERVWFRSVTYADFQVVSVSSAASLLNVLKNEEPYEQA